MMQLPGLTVIIQLLNLFSTHIAKLALPHAFVPYNSEIVLSNHTRSLNHFEAVHPSMSARYVSSPSYTDFDGLYYHTARAS